jgi:hypothetical protein
MQRFADDPSAWQPGMVREVIFFLNPVTFLI